MRPGASARSIPSTAWISPKRLRSPIASTAAQPSRGRHRRGHGLEPSSADATSWSTAASGSMGRPMMRSMTGRVMRWKKIGPMNACSARIGCIGRIRPAAICRAMYSVSDAERRLEQRPHALDRRPRAGRDLVEDRAHQAQPLARDPDDRAPDQREARPRAGPRDARARIARTASNGEYDLDQALQQRGLARHDPVQRAARDAGCGGQLLHRQLGERRSNEHVLRGGQDPGLRGRAAAPARRCEAGIRATRSAGRTSPARRLPDRRSPRPAPRVLGEHLARGGHHLAPDGRVHGERCHAREPRCDFVSRQVSRCRERQLRSRPAPCRGSRRGRRGRPKTWRRVSEAPAAGPCEVGLPVWPAGRLLRGRSGSHRCLGPSMPVG